MSAKVVLARLFEVALPLRAPFRLSGGMMRVRRSLIVELRDGDGYTGYGESAPFEAPFYSSETVASARACLSDWLLPRIVGSELAGPAEVHHVLAEGVRGNRMARAGVDTAWWDLTAARRGVALAELVTERLDALGVDSAARARREVVECGVALGIPPSFELSELRHQVVEAIDRGYRRIKLKVGPEWHLEPARAARDEIAASGRELPLTVDANGAFDAERDGGILDELDALDLLYIEQPFPSEQLLDHVALAGRLRTPVCVDESLVCDGIARQLEELGGPTVWNVKVQRVGGLEEACRITARALRAGKRLWVGTMPETGVGAQATLALAAHTAFVYPTDMEPSERWYPPHTDLIELTMSRDGLMPVPGSRPAIDLGDASLVCEVGAAA